MKAQIGLAFSLMWYFQISTSKFLCTSLRPLFTAVVSLQQHLGFTATTPLAEYGISVESSNYPWTSFIKKVWSKIHSKNCLGGAWTNIYLDALSGRSLSLNWKRRLFKVCQVITACGREASFRRELGYNLGLAKTHSGEKSSHGRGKSFQAKNTCKSSSGVNSSLRSI